MTPERSRSTQSGVMLLLQVITDRNKNGDTKIRKKRLIDQNPNKVNILIEYRKH